MIVTAAVLNDLRTGFSNLFEQGKTKATPMYSEIATLVPSTTKSNTYGWLGQFPAFREWIGDRVLNSMKEHGYSVENKDYESSIGVLRTDIEDDNLGIYNALFTEMGYAASVHPDEIVFPMLRAGFTSTCYDGQYFFDTDHPVNPEVDGSGTDASVSNVIVDGAYTGEAWYLMDTSRAIKPIIFQQRKAPVFTSMTKLDDEAVFTKNLFRYGVDCRDNAGYGFWQMAVGVKAELNYQNVWDAINLMRSFKADGGRPLGLGKTGFKLVVHSTDWQGAKKLKEREFIDDGGVSVSNELRNMFDVISPDFL